MNNNDKGAQIANAMAVRDRAILAATRAFDHAVLAIVNGGESVPILPSPFDPITVRPQDLNNDEILRRIIRGFKTYNTTNFCMQ